MLHKMRWRFILSAMLATFVVMAVLVAAINLWNYSIVTNRQDEITDSLINFQHMGREHQPFAGKELFTGQPPEAAFTTRFFSVHCNADGMVTGAARDYIASVSEDEAAEYAQKVLRKKQDAGYYGDYRYAVQRGTDGINIVFLNCAGDLQFMRSLLFTSCAVALGNLIVVFVLVVLFSKRAIDPYLKNMEMQTRFITDAGHEIKTPLTSIAASADVLALEHAGNEWVENIQKQSVRLSKLVGNLVTLSRLDEETPFPEKTLFSLSEAAWEISEPFAARAKAAGKIYRQEIGEGLDLRGDRSAVQQMLSILLDNAVRYSDDGGRISFRVYQQRKNIVIEVRNTCNMENITDTDRLFDRFYRPDQSRSINTGGSGIGLSIAKATAQAHGGKMEAVRESKNSILFRVVLQGQ